MPSMQKVRSRIDIYRHLFFGKSDLYWLIIIIMLAIMLRVAVAIFLGNEVVNLPGTFDQLSYDMLAKRFLGGHGLTVAEMWWPLTPGGEPTAHWSFLYTSYLIGVYSIFGYSPLIARLIQAMFVGIFMPWLIYRLGRRHFDSHVGLLAAGLTAVYIYFVYYAGALMTETFYITAILWVLDIGSQLGSQPENGQSRNIGLSWLWLGLAISITVLLRQVFLLFLPFLFLWLMWRSLQYQTMPLLRMMMLLSASTIVLILMILPWTYRNYQAFNQFVLLNTNAGFAFYWGNHPIHNYNFISILPEDGPSYQDLIPPEFRDLNEAEMDRALLNESMSAIVEDPQRYIILSFSRIKDYFKFWPSTGSSTFSNLARTLSFGILWPFMLYGLMVNWRHILSSELLLLYLFMVVYTGIHLLTWALIRYRLPVDAFLLIFAGHALLKVQRHLAARLIKQNPEMRNVGSKV